MKDTINELKIKCLRKNISDTFCDLIRSDSSSGFRQLNVEDLLFSFGLS